MKINEFNTYKDILVQCYKHQDALEEVMARKSELPFATIRQAQELHRRNAELISQIYGNIKGTNTDEKNMTTLKSGDIVKLFD